MSTAKPLVLIPFIFLAACAPQPAEPEPTAPPPLTVGLTPATALLEEAVTVCAGQIPETGVQLRERFYPFIEADLTIHLGEPDPFPGFAATLAEERLLVITHPANPAASLTLDQVEAVFSGRIKDWSALGGGGGAIQVWAFYPADETRRAFDRAVLGPGLLTPDALLAPHPEAMLEVIAADPTAIGYLPAAFANEEVASILLGVELPVLALAETEPQGAALDLLLCLQSGPGQQIIRAHFNPD